MPRHLTLALAAASALIAAAPGAAQQTPADSTRVHVVRPGDTLWDLARRYMGDPYSWPEIFQLNRGSVADPNRIFPRERLRIPFGLDPAVAGATLADGPARSVFYQPERATASRLVDRAEIDEPSGGVTRGEFHRAPVLTHPRDVTPVGHVAEVLAPTVVPLQTQPQIQPYDRVFVRVSGAMRAGDRLQLVRRGREIAPFGFVFEPTGLATVESVRAGTATVVVEQLFQQVLPGDLAVQLPEHRDPEASGGRAAGPTGKVLGFQDPHPLARLNDIALLDLGSERGLEEGDELEVYIPETRASWGTRPEVRVARLRVVRASTRTAAARVIGVDHPALQPGLPVRMVPRAP